MTTPSDEVEERARAACRAAGRTVAAALFGFTVQKVAVARAVNEARESKLMALVAFKQDRASENEKAFIDLAGTWAELDGVEFAGDHEKAKTEILTRVETIYPEIDPRRTRLGLKVFVEDWGPAVRALVEELLLKEAMSGAECGTVIMANIPRLIRRF